MNRLRNEYIPGDNILGLLPHIVYAAGFEHRETTMEDMTIFGTLSLYRAGKPG